MKFDLGGFFTRSHTVAKTLAHDHPLDGRPGWHLSDAIWRFVSPSEARRLPMLNLGCGAHFHAAWINVDVAPIDPTVMRHDLERLLPFANETFSVVYHSHVLEHLPKQSAPRLMRECYRVLAPGGYIRVAVPDLEQICKHYVELVQHAADGDAEAAKRYDWMVIELLDQMTRQRSGGEMLKYWRQRPMPAADFVFARVGQEASAAIAAMESDGTQSGGETALSAEEVSRFRLSGETHQWMYDRFSMARLLREAGFDTPIVRSARGSAIEDFRSFGLDTMPDGTTRKPDSLFMEATRSPNR